MADYNAYLVPGVIVAYVAGILQPLVTRTASFVCILAGPVLSILFEQTAYFAFDHELQGFHRAGLATLACYGVLLVVSLLTRHERDHEREQYTFKRFKAEQLADAGFRPFGGRTTNSGPACWWPARWGCAGFSGSRAQGWRPEERRAE